VSWRLATFEALDVLVSADARPLADGGFGHDGEISPAAFAGCLRTLILRRAGYRFGAPSQTPSAKEAARVIGLGLDSGFDFRFGGPLLWAEDELLFPAPSSLAAAPDGEVLGTLTPARDDEFLFDRALDRLDPLPTPGTGAELPEGWVTAACLMEALTPVAGAQPALTVTKTTTLLARERRFGHERDPRRGVVAEGRFFSRGVLRPTESPGRNGVRAVRFAGLLDGVEDALLPAGISSARLAGDGHAVRVELFPGAETSEFLEQLNRLRDTLPGLLGKHRGLVLYLATPGIFADGWRPRAFERDTKLVLRGAAVGRPRIVGGWDWKRQQPKRLWRAVPAGSVYFFEIPEAWNDRQIQELVKGYFLAEAVTDVYGQLGFGLAVLGAWEVRRRDEGVKHGSK